MSEGPLFVPGVWGPFWSTIIPGLWSAEGGQSAAGKLVSSYSWQIYGNLGTSIIQHVNFYIQAHAWPLFY